MDILAATPCPRTHKREALGFSRFDMRYSAGALRHDKIMRYIELYGRKVIPLVREMLA